MAPELTAYPELSPAKKALLLFLELRHNDHNAMIRIQGGKNQANILKVVARKGAKYYFWEEKPQH